MLTVTTLENGHSIKDTTNDADSDN